MHGWVHSEVSKAPTVKQCRSLLLFSGPRLHIYATLVTCKARASKPPLEMRLPSVVPPGEEREKLEGSSACGACSGWGGEEI